MDSTLHHFRKQGNSSNSSGSGSQKSDLLNAEVTVNTYAELIPNIVARRFEKKLAINGDSTQVGQFRFFKS